MQVKVFTLRWEHERAAFDGEVLDLFFEDHSAIDVSQHFLAVEGTPALVVVVTYREREEARRPQHAARQRGRPDPGSELSP